MISNPLVRSLLTLPLLAVGVSSTAGSLADSAAPEGRRHGRLEYRITDLGVVSGRSQTWLMNANNLNNRGQVVGWCNDGGQYDFASDSAFIWSRTEGLDSLPGFTAAATTLAIAINDLGQAVGASGDPYPEAVPVLWTRRGPRGLHVPEGFLGGLAFGINNCGTIVGNLVSEDGVDKPVVWDGHRAAVLPGVREGDDVPGLCFAINDRGVIVGMSDLEPAVWVRGQAVPLGTFGGGYGQANGVNQRGDVVGFALDADGTPRGFIWNGGDLLDLTVDEGFTIALSINNQGLIVGVAGTGNPGGDAVLWVGGRRVDLASTIPANSGWVLLEADCINDRGQISGFGLLNGTPRAFLLTPRN